MGMIYPLDKMTPKEQNHYWNTFRCIERNPRFSGWAVNSLKESENEKMKKHAGVQLHPSPHPTPVATATEIGTWGGTAEDIINYAKV